jgi:hypothetical protein
MEGRAMRPIVTVAAPLMPDMTAKTVQIYRVSFIKILESSRILNTRNGVSWLFRMMISPDKTYCA